MDVVLALGGGGVKCFAQLGALRGLERAGLRVRGVAATSAGGLVGAGLAAGHGIDALVALCAAAQGAARLRRARRGEALLDARAAHRLVEQLVGARTFDDLALPLALTTARLDTGAPHVLQRGAVGPALRAAIAVPGLFAPQPVGPWQLIDGGAVDPVPVRAARALAPGLPVVAVVVTPELGVAAAHPAGARLARLPLLRRLGALRPIRALEVFVRAADFGHRALVESRLALDAPELVVRPRVAHLDLFAAVDVDALVAEGERALWRALDESPRQLAPASAASAAARRRATAIAGGTPAP